MAQASTKVIDLSRSYVPMDPNGFPESMHATGAEDNPEQRVPVIPYAGYNFMPTGYGYMSYFGINSLFEKPLLELATPFDPLNCDDLFIVQTPSLSNILVALCEDGIYTKQAANTDPWEKVIALTVPDAGEHLNYTKVIIGNEVYIYRATEDHVWVMRAAENFVPTELTPNHLTMSAQQGIFRAGARLGFWDSANSLAWSDADDKMDFVPELKTGAGAAIFQQIVGKVVNVLAHGNGFVIYCTRAIVHCQRTTDNNFLFAANTVFDGNGISYLQEACQGQPDTLHFAYTTFGIVKIENGKADYIIPEVFSYLKESRDPVYPKILEGRYLFLQVLNPDYITGIPNFSVEEVPGSTITFKGASYAVSHISENPCKALRAAEQNESRYLYDNYGFTRNTQASAPSSVPVWEDHLSHNIILAIMEAYKASGVSGMGSVLYFDGLAFNNGNIAKIDGSGNESFLPPVTSCPGLLTDYLGVSPTLPLETIEPNEKNFFMKQDFLWLYEQNFFNDWKDGIRRRNHDPVQMPTLTSTFESAVVRTKNTFGPFINLDFFSEANKWYGTAEKSAWLQRSLVKGTKVEVIDTLETLITGISELGWIIGADGGTILYPNYAAAAGAVGGNTYVAWLLTQPGVVSASYVSTEEFNIGSPNYERYIRHQLMLDTGGGSVPVNIDLYPAKPGADPDETGLSDRFYIAWIDFPGSVPNTPIGYPVYLGQNIQTFSRPEFVEQDMDVCVYKNLGYTKIISRGHYELDGTFVNDTIVARTEENALPILLIAFSMPNEAAMWAAVGTFNKIDFIAFWNGVNPAITSYVTLADFVSPGWSEEAPEAPDYVDQCLTPPEEEKKPRFNGIQIPNGISQGCLPGPVTINEVVYQYPDQVIELPPSSFLMQDGSIEPIYPTFQGAFVYDLQLKKWGKCGQAYKQILNYSPINSQAGDKPVPQDIFSVNAGCLLEDGNIAIFDKYPVNGFITFGKIGYYRHGFTDCHGIDLQFRDLATGSVTLEGSIDGKNINPAISQIRTYENVNQVSAGFSSSARWFNLTIDGIYDLKNIDFNGNRHGKR